MRGSLVLYGGTINDVECVRFFLFMKAGIALQQPGAPVPAKNGVVVVWRVNHLSLGEAAHGLGEERREAVGRTTHSHLSFGSPLMQKSGVIKAFVALD